MIQIHSERLLIRDHVRSDLDAMHAWISDPEVMRFLDWKTSSLTETKILLDNAINEIRLQSRKKYFFAVVHKESNNIIGDIGFTIISGNKLGGLADSGFFFLKEFWGSGYATEAFKLIIEFAFTQINVHKVIAGCDAENKASENVMIRSGLFKEGEFKKHLFHRGKWCDRLNTAVI